MTYKKTNFIVIIPARFSSKRLPGKLLQNIQGRPIILHTLRHAKLSGAERVIVATDHKDIFNVVKESGGEACMTSSDHNSGTERLSEVIQQYSFKKDTIIVNVQGNEPMVPASAIRKVAHALIENPSSTASTMAVPIKTLQQAANPNVIKVVRNSKGFAIYFSRTLIPWNQDIFSIKCKTIGNSPYSLRHVGVYAYRVDTINRYLAWEESPLEKMEMLEQLRILWHGKKIYVSVLMDTIISNSIDTPEDLERIREILTLLN